jgi:hypothetical protein
VGLRDVFATGVRTIRRAFGDVPSLADIEVYASTVYDPETGSAAAWTVAAADVPVFWIDYSVAQVDGQSVLQDDRLVLLAALDLPTGLVPGTNDRVIDVVSGDTWSVQRVVSDPAAAHYQLQVRR